MRATKWLVAALAGIELLLAVPVQAQGNNNDYTPLNSRIRRERQFPTSMINPWNDQTSAVSRARNRAMLNQFSKCVFNRSQEDSLDLLQKTDFGFASFEQVGLENERAARIYGFHDCLGRVADAHGTGVRLSWSAGALRQWIVQEAYFDRYGQAPTWIKPGIQIAEREFPLSAQRQDVLAQMEIADCLVAGDPYTADFFYRTVAGTEEETRALETLRVPLGACVPQNQRLQLSPFLFRLWVGEALWHAANHNTPAPAEAAEAAQ